MNKFIRFIIKRPVKIILTTLFIMSFLALGATNITLRTGNDTLISSDTEIYKDNQAYQDEFGKDPIILIFDDEEMFSAKTMRLINNLHNDVKDIDGVFAVNSPITIINEISIKMYEESRNGLSVISQSLLSLGENLQSNEGLVMPDMKEVKNGIQQLISSQEMLSKGLDQMFDGISMLRMVSNSLNGDLDTMKNMIEEDLTLESENIILDGMINDINIIIDNLANLDQTSDISDIPNNTILVIKNIMLTLEDLNESMAYQVNAFDNLSKALINMGRNIQQLNKNFDAFYPGFPSSDETLKTMTHENGEVRKNLEGFKIAENKIRMVIILNGDIKDSQIDYISDTLYKRLDDDNVKEGVLISGKPILDRSIKSSMMGSMKIMMVSAVIVMIMILIAIYNVRMRLLPIIMILIAVAVTIGIMGWLDMGLTMVSMAVFPILIGLGIDYFIQFQTRYEEERGKL